MDKKEWIVQKTILLHQHFYRKLTNQPHWIFRPTDRQLAMVERFTKLLHKKYGYLASVGQDFLTTYFIFQYQYWKDLETEVFGKNKVMIGWIVGPKAWKRWCDRDVSYDFLIHQGDIAKQLNIRSSEINEIFEKKSTDPIYSDVEEEEKMRFHNTPKGQAWCVQETTLYSKRSKACIKCRFQTSCKEILKVRYNGLYNARGYQ